MGYFSDLDLEFGNLGLSSSAIADYVSKTHNARIIGLVYNATHARVVVVKNPRRQRKMKPQLKTQEPQPYRLGSKYPKVFTLPV